MNRYEWKDFLCEAFVALVAVVVLTVGVCAIVKADEPTLPDVKSEKFTIVERSDAAVVAMSEPKQETKDVKSVYVLIVYAELSDSGTRAILGHVEVNCTLGKVKYGVGYRLGDDNSVLGTLVARTLDWQQIQADSPSSDLYEKVCGHELSPPRETRVFMDGVLVTPIPHDNGSWDQENLKSGDSEEACLASHRVPEYLLTPNHRFFIECH